MLIESNLVLQWVPGSGKVVRGDTKMSLGRVSPGVLQRGVPLELSRHQNDDYDIILSNWRCRHQFFSNFTRFLPIVYSYQVSALSDFNQKKFGEFASLIIFLAKPSPINWLPWQQ